MHSLTTLTIIGEKIISTSDRMDIYLYDMYRMRRARSPRVQYSNTIFITMDMQQIIQVSKSQHLIHVGDDAKRGDNDV
jgi:hypothetical protein